MEMEMTTMTHDIEAKPKQKVERPHETTRPGLYFQPAVDIVETSDELLVLADMPGVTPEGLDVRLEGDVLTISGRPKGDEYEGLKPLHVEYSVGGFHRRFTLGETIDRERIKAELRNGVLQLHLPKAERAKARRIEVLAA
jgi:HSP20 family molecular chaperone IbpA